MEKNIIATIKSKYTPGEEVANYTTHIIGGILKMEYP